jgi:hypothetical protein
MIVSLSFHLLLLPPEEEGLVAVVGLFAGAAVGKFVSATSEAGEAVAGAAAVRRRRWFGGGVGRIWWGFGEVATLVAEARVAVGKI